MNRNVERELLDELPATDPGAMRSRRDLRRLNFFMGHAGVITGLLLEKFDGCTPRRIVDLGAGDGTLILRVARRLSKDWRDVEVVLVDRHRIVTARTRAECEAMSWRMKLVETDVFEWLTDSGEQAFDLIVANLFLHHFAGPELRRLLALAAGRTSCLVACEPRRYPVAAQVCRWLWLIGCNKVTQHDAAASVRAGFNGKELSALWPANGAWRLEEKSVGLFTHCFVAQRKGMASEG